jgi:hypothetical protein
VKFASLIAHYLPEIFFPFCQLMALSKKKVLENTLFHEKGGPFSSKAEKGEVGTHTMCPCRVGPNLRGEENISFISGEREPKNHLKNVPFYNLLSFIRQEILPDCKNTRIENLTPKPCLYLEGVCCMIHTIDWKAAVGC